MDLGDLLGDAENLLDNDAVKSALHSAQAESISDGLLGKAKDAIENATGHRFDGVIDQGASAADGAIGNQ